MPYWWMYLLYEWCSTKGKTAIMCLYIIQDIITCVECDQGWARLAVSIIQCDKNDTIKDQIQKW